jgi:hypothetical protein
MTAKKKQMPDWAEAAGASQVGVDPEAVNASPAAASTRPAARSKAPAPSENIVRVEREMKSTWRQLTPRVHPDVWNAFQALAKARRDEYGEQPRDTLTKALNAFFLDNDPVDDYTRKLHERAEAEAAASKRRR